MAYISFQPSDHYSTKLYTGTGASNAQTGVGFQPDFTWIKNRDAADFHVLTDSVRGATKYIQSNDDTLEVTNAESLKSFDSDGFTVGTMNEVNTNTEDIVSWNWKAGTTSGLSGGDITPSAYSINTTSGIGIYKYTGNGTATQTMTHGLGAVPKFMMMKILTGTANYWAVYHEALGNTKRMTLNTTAAESVDGNTWQDTTPTSTVFTMGNTSRLNSSGDDYVAYVFTEKKGYSKFGSYVGNANADGTFVYLGFRPALVIIKRSSTTGNWTIWDDKRLGYNVANNEMQPNLTSAEDTSSHRVDLLSNGFKLRNSSPSVNDGTYIYAAFAEFPIVSSNDVPATAR
jgi:predicted RecA/RadA family phage recombinase